MRRFVAATALALVLSIMTAATRGDTVDPNGNPVSAPKVEPDATPSPYLIKNSDAEVATSRPPAQHDEPQSVPLPGAAWAGIAMMGGLLIGRHIIRRRRRLV